VSRDGKQRTWIINPLFLDQETMRGSLFLMGRYRDMDCSGEGLFTVEEEGKIGDCDGK